MLLTLMIVLALSICVEGSSRSYAIDKVLVSVPLSLGQTHLAVEVRALGLPDGQISGKDFETRARDREIEMNDSRRRV